MHAMGVLHLDIKPANALINVGEHNWPLPKVMWIDFGLADVGEKLYGPVLGFPDLNVCRKSAMVKIIFRDRSGHSIRILSLSDIFFHSRAILRGENDPPALL